MKYTEEMLTHLRNRVSTKMSKKRFIHTLGVEDTANELGEIFLSNKVTELRAAALLHDVAKELPTNELENLLKNTTTLYE